MSGHLVDVTGMPEYFVTELGHVEDAGNGLLRVVRCIKRNGMLIPVFSQIIPAQSVLESLSTVSEMSRKILRGSGPRH